ncbi:hypothetical protein [Dolichospermum compactum]|uniref:hypothetical protein n=1 Tax=Dolichospermum compactum TaxID=136073 RepID=UPI001E639020|nr:hypothetical protein [Dolichospermum compactum]
MVRLKRDVGKLKGCDSEALRRNRCLGSSGDAIAVWEVWRDAIAVWGVEGVRSLLVRLEGCDHCLRMMGFRR